MAPYSASAESRVLRSENVVAMRAKAFGAVSAAPTPWAARAAINMPVLSATQLMIHKLLSYSQHYCDFATGFPVARSLREQIDWRRVRRETIDSPYAEAFMILLDRLDVVPAGRDAPFGEGG